MIDLRQRIDEMIRDENYYDQPPMSVILMGIASEYLNYHFYFANPTGCPIE